MKARWAPDNRPDSLGNRDSRAFRRSAPDFYRDFTGGSMAVIVARTPSAKRSARQRYFGPLRRASAAPGVRDSKSGQLWTLSPRMRHRGTLMHKRPPGAAHDRRIRRSSSRSGVPVQRALLGDCADADAPFLGASAGDEKLGERLRRVRLATSRGGSARGSTPWRRNFPCNKSRGASARRSSSREARPIARYNGLQRAGQSESEPLASELLRHYLQGEAAPGLEAEVDLIRKFLPTVTANEVATLAREMVTDENRVVLATAPERAGLVAATEGDLREALRAGASATSLRGETGAGRDLLTRPCRRYSACARDIPEIGVPF